MNKRLIMKKILILIGIVIIMFQLKSMYSCYLFNLCKEPHWDKLIDRITDNYVNTYIPSKQLLCKVSWTDGRNPLDNIKNIYLSFNSLASIDIGQARQLYVDTVEEYLRRINENEEVRPYLHNYPFTPNNLKFSIRFRDNNHSIKGEGYVALIFICQNIVYYDAYDIDSKKLYNLHKETYEEALSIVKENNQITIS